MTYMKQLLNELTVKRLISETISEGIKAAQLHAAYSKDGHHTMASRQDEAAMIASSILASILPCVTAAEVRMAFDSITKSEIDPCCNITEKHIAFVMERIQAVSEAPCNV